jgi:hypothetical protein
MLAFGIWYLGLGNGWIAWYRGEETTHSTNSGHLITGVQVRRQISESHVRLD